MRNHLSIKPMRQAFSEEAVDDPRHPPPMGDVRAKVDSQRAITANQPGSSTHCGCQRGQGLHIASRSESEEHNLNTPPPSPPSPHFKLQARRGFIFNQLRVCPADMEHAQNRGESQ